MQDFQPPTPCVENSWDESQAAILIPDCSSCRRNNLLYGGLLQSSRCQPARRAINAISPVGSMNIGRPIEIRASTISAWWLIAQTGRQVIQTYLPVLFYIFFLFLYHLIVASDILTVFQANQSLIPAATEQKCNIF